MGRPIISRRVKSYGREHAIHARPYTPTVTVSMSKKLNMGNYESVDLFVSVSGVRAGMQRSEIVPLLTTAKVAWDEVKHALTEQIRMVRQGSLLP